MNQIIQTYLIPIGVILTFFASIMNIYYTRKNLKTSKYIDTVTSERIKWIEKIRLEVSDVYVELHAYLLWTYALFHYENEENNGDEIDVFVKDLDKLKEKGHYLSELKKISKNELKKKLLLVKLKLNPDEDKVLLDILDSFISLLVSKGSKEQIENAFDNLNNFITIAQTRLKLEWEKVKHEAKN